MAKTEKDQPKKMIQTEANEEMKDVRKKVEKKKEQIEKSSKSQDDLNFYIVGVGASAGGLEALEKFFGNMPPDSGMGFVVIQHLSPDYKTLMVELLSKHTRMKVYQAEDIMEVRPNCVYLIPRKKNMTIFHGKLLLTEQNHSQRPNLPIDIFFRSLAEDQGKKAIGVVLSGTGSDGTRGIRAIKEAGGLAIAQDVESAKFDGMPKSAIATRLIDFILPPEKMGEKLLNYIKHPLVTLSNKAQHLNDDDALNKVFSLIRSRHNIDFTYYKQSTVIRRVEKRMGINQISALEGYVDYLYKNSRELDILFQELLIGVTKFFRDPDAFDLLKQKVIPVIFMGKPVGSDIRIWVAGCSTGEEAYSLAILFKEHQEKIGKKYNIKIFATDVDKEAIEVAGTGIYPESIAADVPFNRLEKYFVKRGDTYQISHQIREMVVFATHNVIKDPPFSKIDFISCRNLLIYLQSVLQKKVLSIFHFALNKDGFLFLGTSETIGDKADLFVSYDNKWKIYQYKGGEKPNLIGDLNLRKSMEGTYSQPFLEGLSENVSQDRLIDTVTTELMKDYVPPSVIVDNNLTPIHTFSHINDYLKLPSGQVDLNLLKLVDKNLSVALSTAIKKAKTKREQIVFQNVSFKENDTVKTIDLVVRPYSKQGDRFRNFLIIFKPTKQFKETSFDENVEDYDFDSNANQRIMDLMQELQYTKENHQATVEELETSNEELQATNEELMAANEELQSTNEELQSVNEELITVNSEYQAKINELTELNNDMNNLLSSTKIGTIFLDNNLYIRKFTPFVKRVINLIDSDVGRPITHISFNIKHENLVEDVVEVLDSLRPIEREIQNKDGEWFLKRIMPYRTSENQIKGVVITFIDISEVKKAHKELAKYSLAVEQSPAIVVMLDTDANIEYVNQRFTQITGYKPEEVVGQHLRFLQASETPQSVYESVWAKLEAGEVWKGELLSRQKSGDVYWELASILPVKDEEDNTVYYLKVAEDISELKEAQENLKKEKELLETIMETSPIGITIVNKEGKITFANREAEDIFGLSKSEITRRQYDSPEWKIVDKAGDEIPSEELPFNQIMKTGKPVYSFEHAIVKSDGDTPEERIYLSISGAPITDKSGEPNSVIFAVEDQTQKVKSEKALSQKEAQYHMLFDRMLNAFALHETIVGDDGKPIDYRFLEVNPAFEKMTGLRAENIVGEKVLDVLPNTELYWIKKYGEVALSGESKRFEAYSEELGKYFDVFAFSPEKGKFATIFTDVTDQREAERQLRESRERHELAQKVTQTGVWHWNIPENELYFSKQAERLLNLSAEKLGGTNEEFLKNVHPEDRKFVAETIDKAIKNGEEYNIEHRLLQEDGSVRWLCQKGDIITDEDGTPIRLMGVVQDITDKYDLREKLERYKKPIEILLVEDDPTSVELMKATISSAKVHYHLSTVDDGEEALKFLKNDDEYADAPTPELILLDLMMPKVNGLEVLEAIKNAPELSEIPVIIMTASTEEEDLMQAYELGASAYIQKPFRKEDFFKALNSIEDFWFVVKRNISDFES